MDALKRARSWLFVPATRPDRFAKAVASGADRVILDLEDAVAADAKASAREALLQDALPTNVPVYVRINAYGTPWFRDDLETVARIEVAGVLLPKAEAALQVDEVAAALNSDTRIVPIIESALGEWNMLEVARAARVERLAFGALDFQVDTGIRGDDDQLAPVRTRLVVASRVAGIAPPIDAVSPSIEDQVRLREDCLRTRRFGFAGKLCIHPAQVGPIHAALRPSDEELDWARGLIAELDRRPAHEQGTFAYRGQMVDRPVIERARHILAVD